MQSGIISMYVWWMQVSFFHISLIPNCEYLGIVHVSTHMCMWLRLMLLPVFILCRLQLGKLCPTGSQRFTVVHIKVPSLNKSNQSWESYFACDLNFFISRKQPLCACCVRWSGIMTMRNQVKLNWVVFSQCIWRPAYKHTLQTLSFKLQM